SRDFRPAWPAARNSSRHRESVAAVTPSSRESSSRASPRRRRRTASALRLEENRPRSFPDFCFPIGTPFRGHHAAVGCPRKSWCGGPFACRRAHGPWGGSYLEALSLPRVDRCSHGIAIVPSSISWYFGERMRSAGLAYIVTDSISTSLLRQQLRWMREAGFDVTVISAPGERLIRCAEEEGARAVAVPMAR